MLDAVSLDQVRIFVAAVDTGSFSAAARQLGRAQSVVSRTLANLEVQLGIKLFDRAKRLPVPTAEGLVLLPEARAIIASINAIKAMAKGLSHGLEPELSIVVDVMFPIDVVTSAVAAFQVHFPDTPLRLYVEALGAVVAPVMRGECALGIMGSLPYAPNDIMKEQLTGVPMTMAVSPLHPLSRVVGPVHPAILQKHVQLVLTDRSSLSKNREFAVISPKTWRLADLGAKHAFLRAGLGYGGMPFDLVQPDFLSGALVPLEIDAFPSTGFIMPMAAIYRIDTPPGPAGRWFIEYVKSVR